MKKAMNEKNCINEIQVIDMQTSGRIRKPEFSAVRLTSVSPSTEQKLKTFRSADLRAWQMPPAAKSRIECLTLGVCWKEAVRGKQSFHELQFLFRISRHRRRRGQRGHADHRVTAAAHPAAGTGVLLPRPPAATASSAAAATAAAIRRRRTGRGLAEERGRPKI